ncbi:MAG: ABC transporter permease [Saprospiraceae bacterium]|nr:ABC transporter permease [Saprospiraceae bacterium]
MIIRKKKYISSESLSALARKKFKKNKLSYFSLWFIILSIAIAILGYWITPDSTPFANEQFLELTTNKPGFSVSMLKVRKNEKTAKSNIFSKMIWGEKSKYSLIPIANHYFDGDKIYVEEFTGFEPNNGAIISYELYDVVYSLASEKVDISAEELKNIIEEKNIVKKRFLLGSDRFGRDMLSRLIIGARVSLAVGFISVLISLIVGIFLGSVAGFFRGKIDDVIIWFINVVWSIPTLLLVIAITFALGKGFWQVFIAVGLTMWVEVARVVRGQILSIREKEFVEAGKALGYKNFRIIFRHILPNVMGAVIVISAANFASAILIEAGLSFLGIGVQPPMPSWGSMIKDHYGYIILNSAYLAILPGIAIMLMVLAFMLVGNGLRDALDVKTEN